MKLYNQKFAYRCGLLLHNCSKRKMGPIYHFPWNQSKNFDSSTLVYICLHLPSDSSTFFSIWVFLHGHSRITRLQEKWEVISLTPHYHFHPLHKHLYIRQAITAESSPLHIVSSQTPTGRKLVTNKLRALVYTGIVTRLRSSTFV